MFITKRTHNLSVHLNAEDIDGIVVLGDNVKITLSSEKAKELEDRLEKARYRIPGHNSA